MCSCCAKFPELLGIFKTMVNKLNSRGRWNLNSINSVAKAIAEPPSYGLVETQRRGWPFKPAPGLVKSILIDCYRLVRKCKRQKVWHFDAL